MTDREHREKSRNPLLHFATSDPNEFAEKMSGIAPNLNCSAYRSQDIDIRITAGQLPSLGIFQSSLQNFHVRSSSRPFYAVTIPTAGCCDVKVQGKRTRYHSRKAHIQHPGRLFDAAVKEGSLESLQLCFDQCMLDSMTDRLCGEDNSGLSETLDLRRPDAQSFVRHALFIWSEMIRGGAVTSSHLIAKESANMLGTLLVSAAAPSSSIHAPPHHCSAVVTRAEDYIMEHLLSPLSIADVVAASGMSARTLSRIFRRYHGTTIKGFIKQRRLESANRSLLIAEPGQTNVTRVALEHGFDQLGRFSADYKRAFGELPSRTLAK